MAFYLGGAYFALSGVVYPATAPRGLSMSPPGIEIEDGAFLIESSVIATGLDVEPAQLLILIRSGEITSISEQGVVEDAGFHRLTFHYRNRRFRLIVDGAGQIVRRSRVNFGQRGRLPRKRRPASPRP
jgi:uncharacterized protein DUF6522